MNAIAAACCCLSLVLLIACNAGRLEAVSIPDHLTTINLDSVAREVPISQYASQVKYIPLQTCPECRVGKVRKVDFSGDKFVLLSSAADIREVLVFDTLGRFLYKIDHLGDLPVSKCGLYDFDVDRSAGSLYIYYSISGSVGIYNLQTGRLKEELPAPKSFYSLSAVKDHLLFFREGSLSFNDRYGNSRICEFNKDYQLSRSWLDYPVNPLVAMGDMYYSKSPDNASMLISRLACDTFFQYTVSGISARYKIQPAVQYKADVRKASTDRELRTWLYSDRSGYFGGKLFDTRQRIYFEYKHRKVIGLNVFDKRNAESIYVRDFINDINEVVIPFPDFIDDSHFVCLIRPHLLRQQAGFITDTDSRYNTLKNLAGKLRPTDNPVVCLITLKNPV